MFKNMYLLLEDFWLLFINVIKKKRGKQHYHCIYTLLNG